MTSHVINTLARFPHSLSYVFIYRACFSAAPRRAAPLLLFALAALDFLCRTFAARENQRKSSPDRLIMASTLFFFATLPLSLLFTVCVCVCAHWRRLAARIGSGIYRTAVLSGARREQFSVGKGGAVGAKCVSYWEWRCCLAPSQPLGECVAMLRACVLLLLLFEDGKVGVKALHICFLVLCNVALADVCVRQRHSSPRVLTPLLTPQC